MAPRSPNTHFLLNAAKIEHNTFSIVTFIFNGEAYNCQLLEQNTIKK